MPIDTARQLQDLLRTAEAFRAVMIQTGATSVVRQDLYFDQMRALECALQPLNYLVESATPLDKIIWAIQAWQRDGLTTFTPANILQDFGGAIIAALESWSIVEELRAPEGAEVSLFCDNPDFGAGANNAIEVMDDWTGPQWEPRRFEGDTILDALRAAKAARDAHVEIEKVRATGADELERHEGDLEDRERG